MLDRLGYREEAATSLERATQVVQRKLDLLHLPEHRTAFLENVPLNRRIAEAQRANLAGRTPVPDAT